ncbi:hypothetical protein GQ53DRAFT_179658 [Thozetella sp. PMI_491]|nr:hypothetical protein GQ53DRAFT_179658 [Thozetella sp. PMI_491]
MGLDLEPGQAASIILGFWRFRGLGWACLEGLRLARANRINHIISSLVAVHFLLFIPCILLHIKLSAFRAYATIAKWLQHGVVLEPALLKCSTVEPQNAAARGSVSALPIGEYHAPWQPWVPLCRLANQ